MKNKNYIHNLDIKAKKEHNARILKAIEYNEKNEGCEIEPAFYWIDIYKGYLRKRYLVLIFSLVFAYLSFNINAYYETSSDSFYKLLAVSTTLFLSVMSLLKEKLKP